MYFIPFLIAIAVVVILVGLHEKKSYEKFKEKFPPISDAEFLARCAPGTNPDIALRVRRILSESLGVDYDRIYPSSRLVEDLGV